ncbi:MAG: 1-acyl-sn-glycerol-3-phosphate acyltransferase [Lachnospiraceae bacterium]|nr:1-acyl-sn-glycerol-3-phosphate acyltransferase [Lachnospiraceae bacterium]
MVRFVYVCTISLPFIIYYLLKTKYVERRGSYNEEERYRIARHMIALMKWNGMIRTVVYGTENLPADGGYVMYANHQGKYDSLGIISVHQKPCTILIDEKRSQLILVNSFISLLKGSRLDKTDMRSQVTTINQVASEVSSGRRYIVFPEGGYENNGNHIQDFLPGAFKCAIRSKSPIVPVVLVDSYKVFGRNVLGFITTQVHFLPPLMYEDYAKLSSREISDRVHDLIDQRLHELCDAA